MEYISQMVRYFRTCPLVVPIRYDRELLFTRKLLTQVFSRKLLTQVFSVVKLK